MNTNLAKSIMTRLCWMTSFLSWLEKEKNRLIIKTTQLSGTNSSSCLLFYNEILLRPNWELISWIKQSLSSSFFDSPKNRFGKKIICQANCFVALSIFILLIMLQVIHSLWGDRILSIVFCLTFWIPEFEIEKKSALNFLPALIINRETALSKNIKSDTNTSAKM